MKQEAGEQTAGRVLIVDDAADVSSVLAMKLERDGHSVAVAHDAQRAQLLLQADDFDLVLLDIRLPDSSGFELLARIRQQRSPLDTPVIMISGLDETSDVVSALQDGANDYLTKPFDLNVAIARIRTQLALKQLKDANDRFLRVAGDDLRRPLLSMLDEARRLRDGLEAGATVSEAHRAALDRVVDSGEFMRQLITELLELRALRERRLRLTKLPTDLGAIVRQAVARTTPEAQKKDAGLHMEFARDIPNIRADDTRVLQVLENLIGNAIQHGPRGNSITIRTTHEDGWIVCQVSDTGPGIAKQKLDRLFEAYSRLGSESRHAQAGTGLGLAICHELVKLHQGEIGARNNPDGGATFWFRLPVEGGDDDIEEIVLSSGE